MSRLSDDRVGKRVAVHISGNQGDVNGCVFGGGHTLILGNRGVVHRRNRDGNRGNIRIVMAVIGHISKCISAVVVSIGSICKGSVHVQCERAISGISNLDRGQNGRVIISII